MYDYDERASNSPKAKPHGVHRAGGSRGAIAFQIMKRNPLAWMKFDPLIVAGEVDGMTVAQQGAYFILIRHLWPKGPMPEADIRRYIHEHTSAILSTLKQYGDGWSMPWLEDARLEADDFREQRSRAGRRSALNRSTAVQQPFNDRSTVVEHNTIQESRREGEEREKELKPLAWPKWAGEQTLAKWEEFKVYKFQHHRKFRYKSTASEQAAINVLARYYADGRACVAALDEAMAKGWMFPVEPKPDKPPADGGVPFVPTAGIPYKEY